MSSAAAQVTRDNWRTHPHSVWGFRNVRTLLPTRMVPTDGASRNLEEAAIELDRLCFPDGEGESISWRDFLARTHTDAVLVLHGGRIVCECYRNGMEPDQPHMLFSITKSIIGLVAELLALDGWIDLECASQHYVPELKGTGFGEARLRDLLDMRDGVPFDESYDNAAADIHLYSVHYWGDAQSGVEAVLPHFGVRPGNPGQFGYRTPVSDVIGWVLRRATGSSLSALVSHSLWSRIGAEQHAFFLLDHDGNEIAGAGFNATLRDVGRLALQLRDRTMLPGTLVEQLLGGGDRAAFAASRQFPTREGWSYRSFWWVRHDRPALSALGVFGQRIFYDPAADLIVVRFGSHPVASSAATDALHEHAFAALARRLNPETTR